LGIKRTVQSGGGGIVIPSTDPYYAYRSLILNFDGNFNDSSPNALAVTPYGNAQIVSDGTFGSVASFDGSGDRLNSASSPLFAFGTGDFTVEGWFNFNSFNANYMQFGPNVAVSGGFSLYYTGASGYFGIPAYSVVVSNRQVSLLMVAQPLSTTQWYHYAVTRSGITMRLFLDGAQIGTATNSTNFAQGQLTLGGNTDNAAHTINGLLGPLRISPWAEYTSNFTPSQDMFPVVQGYPAYDPRNSLILNMDGTPGSTTFEDDSPNALAVTAVGDAQIVSDATFGTVASFDGSGDYIDSAVNSVFNFGTGDFTVEMWVYPIGSNLFSLYDSRLNETSPNGNGFVIGLNSSLQWVVYQAGNKIIGPTRTLNQWSHVAVVRTGTSVKMYLNGSQIGSTWTTSNSFTDGALLFGTDYPRNARFFNGLIGPTRITKGIARYTANFTPPTGPFPAS
jgi:hypothetical protein